MYTRPKKLQASSVLADVQEGDDGLADATWQLI